MNTVFKKIDIAKSFEKFFSIRLLAHQELRYSANLDINYIREFAARTLGLFGDEAFWHLYDADTLIGQLEMGVKQNNGYVFLFYIYPEYRGKGYFRLMHNKMLEVMRARNFTEIKLATLPSATHAINIYNYYGWEHYGPDIYKPEMAGFRLPLK
jgi:GNAT superfamily N-acetyltransferase